jgi:hypothetical protein
MEDCHNKMEHYTRRLKMKKKHLSLIVIFAMMFSVISFSPITVSADEVLAEPVTLDLADGSIVIKAGAYDFGASTNIENSSNSYIIMQSGSDSATSNTINIQDNAVISMRLEDINISTIACAIGITAGSQVELVFSGKNYLRSGEARAGLEVPAGAELIVAAEADGSLNAYGGEYAAGIGGGRSSSAGSIIIKGGIITAEGGSAPGGKGAGAGIGGGQSSSGGTITIEGGEITASGGYRAAGIGGGEGGSSGIIMIKGGNINATAGDTSYSAGIGGGCGGKADTITIEGGTVVATGHDGAGIGGGRMQNAPVTEDGGTINISGGNITASSSSGAGIGGGLLVYSTYYMPTTINITGGIIKATSSYGGINSNQGVINISGGEIYAESTNYGAGIGGAFAGGNHAGTINISGGTIVAQGCPDGGAGIGGGYDGNAVDVPGSIINISGGDITAAGGRFGAGIGGGYGMTAGVITITGGNITARGQYGSAIGSGAVGWNGTGGGGKIILSQAVVNASVENPAHSTAINAGPSGVIHIGFTGEPSEWVCDPIDTRAEINFVDSGFSPYGLVFGTCLIEGAGEVDGSYIEGVKQIAADTTAPVLLAGAINRISDTDATVTFTSDEAGEYYYEVATAGSQQPDIDTSGSGTPCDTSEQTISLGSLSAGDLDIYIVVKDAAGNVSEALQMEIPAYIPPIPGIIQFESSSHSTYEGYNGWMIGVERTEGSDGEVSVSYDMVDGTAKAWIHYQPYSGTLTWADGDSSRQVIRFTSFDDSVYNGYLDLTCILANPTGGAVLGEQKSLIVHIRDNDAPPVPAGLKATAGNGQVVLSWEPVKDARYKLYYSTKDDEFTEGSIVEIYDDESYTMTGLENGTTYYFAIKSGHDIYWSELSSSISATPKAPATGGGGGGGGYEPPVKEEPLEEEPVEEEPIITEPEQMVLNDISGHWAQKYIEHLVKKGAITGYPDKSFQPDATITRAEFAVVLVKALGLSGEGKVFADTAAHWAKEYIATAAAQGIILGYNDEEFGPDDLITREQMAIMIVKAAGLEAGSGETGFTDKTDISPWAREWVLAAVSNDLMSGYPDNSFKPLNNASRAETVTVVFNALK